jgi:hypothetical protein
MVPGAMRKRAGAGAWALRSSVVLAGEFDILEYVCKYSDIYCKYVRAGTLAHTVMKAVPSRGHLSTVQMPTRYCRRPEPT